MAAAGTRWARAWLRSTGDVVSALSLTALAVAHGELARGVRGGIAPWGRFRSADIDAYMTLVGLAPHVDQAQEGWPWCAAGVYACFKEATLSGSPFDEPPPNPCPRTAGALHMWDLSPLAARAQLAAPGDVFVLDRGQGRGHVGFVLAVSPDGKTFTTLEPNTSSATLSATGDAWGQHLWQPADGARGKLIGYLHLG